MKDVRKLLFPFAILYGIVTGIRNFLYNRGIFRAFSFDIPVIAVGNLSTGGTGKSPLTEYLVRLLKDSYSVATLSRGYKRSSKGFVLADDAATAATLGDEPYQFHLKFPDIQVAVDADRVNGITRLLSLPDKPGVIVLDDAYQHRRVKAGLYILLTAYGDIYADDLILPAGNLREGRSGAKRADIIVVTKCPPDLALKEQENITRKLKPQMHQKVYFTCIAYDEWVYSGEGSIKVTDVKPQDKVLVAGIAKPEPFFSFLKNDTDHCLTYPDHHNFTASDIEAIINKSDNRIIITTEKDYTRLKGSLPADKLFYLPIKSSFVKDAGDFDKTILEYVGKSTGNR
ncbi:tetraacyldisaccharide 4'-kinase [Flavobacterium cyanobacteriorum]|uniref:Tetraacyldisaccharide 4'-kinase n=1 Tax=Flavobacterium cyanobacteriorum TaxID=2022802 RepID=A0A255ZA58_9FLAO|nr:tetraacyldisaccharide 4'-kinase [Flavobacterium cyanobacteriorum]OYQ38358.1 tetraacyldisaccharide 4'-kinase [Flavobacterium cyanobacteriorum]